jgi:N-acetyl-alpha-D-muramate 1-phosphate uridylyltransferase
MDAMILAAGLGTRLGELTRDTPKALIEVGGVPVIERVAKQLIDAGADRLIINVHHHADRIVEYVNSRQGFGVEVLFSREHDAPLETGGGLLHAAPLFRRDKPFFLHNVDVLCDADLVAMYRMHVRSKAVATLAVDARESSRYLLFGEDGLCGRMDTRSSNRADLHATCGDLHSFAFAGIHVVSPTLLGLIQERGSFSIVDVYLRLAGEGHRIRYYDITGATWLEVGNPERLEMARRAFEEK